MKLAKINNSRKIKLLLSVLVAMLQWTGVPPAGAQTPLFGPKQYTRVSGAPQTFSETFSRCGTAACRIVVDNGNADGTHRVSSASISLNGAQILGPADFKQQVGRIVRLVALGDQNQLTVKLASGPGSFLTVDVEYDGLPARLSAGSSSASLTDSDTRLLSAVQILNDGRVAAQDVQVTAITIPSGALSYPAALPLNLGTIPAGQSVVLDANFVGTAFTPEGRYPLKIQGTYSVGADTYCYNVTNDLVVLPAPGSVSDGSVVLAVKQTSGGPFPPQPEGPERPTIRGLIVPFDPAAPAAAPPGGTTVVPAPIRNSIASPIILQTPLGNAAGPINFVANNGVGISDDTTTEPSGGASGGGVVFLAANFFAAYSLDGITFNRLDPTTIFPDDGVGFGGDQVVQYVPSIDRFIWCFLGTACPGTTMRVAWASPADIVNSGGMSWTYIVNFSTDIFAPGKIFDYPDMSVGNNYLYLSWAVSPPPCDGDGNNVARQVARIPLSHIQAAPPAGTVGVDYTTSLNDKSVVYSHLTQNTGNEVFWAGHPNTSHLRVYSWVEGPNHPASRDIGISGWSPSGITSMTTGGQDWFSEQAQFVQAVSGATRSGNQLWFAWTAGTDGNFPQPHVEMVALDRGDNFHKLQQVQIWNPNYAFGFPALASCPCTGEIGLSLFCGGNGNYVDHVVGLWGDFLVYGTTASDADSPSRYGDFLTIRQATPTDANPGNLFTAFGYGVNGVPQPGSGVMMDIRYVLFGRPASSCTVIPFSY